VGQCLMVKMYGRSLLIPIQIWKKTERARVISDNDGDNIGDADDDCCTVKSIESLESQSTFNEDAELNVDH